MEYHFLVSEEDAAQRLDRYLSSNFSGSISRTYVQKLIKEKKVTVNGKTVKSHYPVREGDEIFVEVPEPRKLEAEPEDIPLEIVFEDGSLLVVDKPAGMVVHPGAGNHSGTLVNALIWHCRDLSGIGGVLRPGIVHRLDKDTSGLLMVAKNDLVHRSLADQLKRRKVKREYLCLVKGVVQVDEGIVDAPVGRHPRNRQKMAINFADGRPAVTKFQVVTRFKNFTLLRLSLGSGRTHQIRLHMAYAGYPVLGDRIYGAMTGLINRQALHAGILGFKHPVSGEYLEFKSDLPEDIERVIEKGEKKP